MRQKRGWMRALIRWVRSFSVYNWLRFRLWEKHHVLKLRYIKPGWIDKDEVLIHAMFEVLCRFIEDEAEMISQINWDSDSAHEHARAEMTELYEWWKRRKDRDDQNPLFSPGVRAPDFVKDTSVPPVTLGNGEKCYQMKFVHESPEAEKLWDDTCKQTDIWEKKCDEEDEEMMQRLLKIRRFLWT